MDEQTTKQKALTSLEKAEEQAKLYIESLYILLPSLNVSIPDQRGKAHGILNMVGQIQLMHKLLKNPNTTHEQRKDAFEDFFHDFYDKRGK